MAKKKTPAKTDTLPVEKKTGRPRIPIDPKMVGELATVGCSIEEIAAMLRRSGVKASSRTLERRLQEPEYRELWEDGHKVMNVKLRSSMMRQAQMLNGPGVHMAMFLAINRLGMSNRVEHKVDARVEIIDSARDRLARKLEILGQRIASRALRGAGAKTITGLPIEAERGGDGEPRIPLVVLGSQKPDSA